MAENIPMMKRKAILLNLQPILCTWPDLSNSGGSTHIVKSNSNGRNNVKILASNVKLLGKYLVNV